VIVGGILIASAVTYLLIFSYVRHRYPVGRKVEFVSRDGRVRRGQIAEAVPLGIGLTSWTWRVRVRCGRELLAVPVHELDPL
jgi:hypothetical protein